jgi:hypothetical protein
MRDAILLQQASEEQAVLLALTAELHRAYVERHGMAFWTVVRRMVNDYSIYAGWDKFVLIQQALRRGYEHVFWIDADAAVVGDVDLREALTTGCLGMVEHPGPPVHFNCGIILMRNRRDGRSSATPLQEFVREVWERRPGEHPWYEQTIMNEMIADGWPGFEQLDLRWNSTFGIAEADEPVIVGWHGGGSVGEKYGKMRAFLGAPEETFRRPVVGVYRGDNDYYGGCS